MSLSLEDIINQSGVGNIDKECSDEDILAFGDYCDPWRLVGLFLGLDDALLNAIDDENRTVSLKRLGTLQKWKETFAFQATYGVLINALLQCGKADQALQVCKILAQKEGKGGGTVDTTPRAQPIEQTVMQHASPSVATSASPSVATPASRSMLDLVIVSPKHFGQIADFMYEWEGAISEGLGLTQADVAAIKMKYPGELSLQVRAALWRWRQIEGSAATYNNLIGIFERADHVDYADTVRHIFKLGPEGISKPLPWSLAPSESTKHPRIGETLSDKEASELMDKYDHLFMDPNVVSLDYRIIPHQKVGKEISSEQKMLCIGVIKEDIGSELPKVAVYKTEEKHIEVPVHVFVQGEIEALAAYEGGSEIKNEALNICGTVGVNTIFRGKYRLLTCAHILTEFDDANISNHRKVEIRYNPEDEAFQLIPVTIEDHVRATVYDTPSQGNPARADQDLAWATLTVAHGLPSVKEIGSVSGIRKPELDEKIALFGAASQVPLKNIPIISNIARPRMKFQTSNGGEKYVFFRNFWTLDITEGIVMRGDSGSAIIAEIDKAVVGILVCGDQQHLYAYFCALEI